jgi:hypothetical protein
MPTGIGTTSISNATPDESGFIQSTLGLTRGSNNSKNIIESLKEDKEQKIKQREGTNDILLLTDVTIDGYDKLIVNMDKPVPGLIQEINTKITNVKSAYEQRIAAGCLSDLKWIKTGEVTRTVSIWSGSGGRGGTINAQVIYQYWQVQKDPDQYRQINYYGLKYYKRPYNRDYGANIIKEVSNASVGIGSTYMIVFDTSPTAITGIQTGDTITDNLESPSIFSIGNLPEVVGFGSTPILGFSTTFYGDISIGSTILTHTGAGVVTVGISTGTPIVRVGVTSSDTVVVGFGTTTATITIIDDEGEVAITTSTVNTLILSKPAIASTSLSSFGVGIVTYYPTIFISTTSSSGGTNTNFIFIRSNSAIDEVFDYTTNGSDPVEIGLIKDNSKVGYGHSVVVINNGSQDIVTNWREVIDPEPAVGAGYAPYYVGAANWPGQNIPIRGGVGGTSIVGYSFTYRPEGYQVVIGIGLTTPQPILTTTSTKPPGAADNSTCTTYTSNITTSESDMNSTISTNLPKINYYADASDILRDVRDEKESLAWSMKRGNGFLTEEINKLTQQIATLETIDFTEFESD